MPVSAVSELSVPHHLQALYGSQGEEVYRSLRELMGNALPAALPRRDALPLTQNDALLITYGDQLREPSVPPLRTLGRICEAYLRDAVSGVHLLPFYPFTSDDGFAVTDYFSVDPALGGWNDVELLGQHFDLMFDAVFNHLSARSGWFEQFLAGNPRFRDFFVTVEGDPDLSQVIRPRALPLLTDFETASGTKKVWTTFSADQVDLNFSNPAVLLAVLRALLFYVSKGARFIRLDAIAYLWKQIGTPCIHLPQTHRIVRLMRAVLDVVSPRTLLITETNVPHRDNLSYFGDGTDEAQLVYNFTLPPLVLHTFATGDATALSRWASGVRLPSNRVTFFNFLASHDGIGVNPVRGILTAEEIEALLRRVQDHGGLVSFKHNADGSRSPYELNINYFDALSNPRGGEPLETQIARFLAAQAIMLALAGVPGIYFHSLFGSRNDREAADATGIPRRINRQKLQSALLEAELADASSLRARVFAGFKRLLETRREHPAFHPLGGQEIVSAAGCASVFAVLRTAPDAGERVLCLQNVSAAPTEVSLPVPGDGGRGGLWRDLAGSPGEYPAHDRMVSCRLAPYQVAWLRES